MHIFDRAYCYSTAPARTGAGLASPQRRSDSLTRLLRLSHSLSPSLTHFITHFTTHSLTHSPTHSLTHSYIHSLTHSFKNNAFLPQGNMSVSDLWKNIERRPSPCLEVGWKGGRVSRAAASNYFSCFHMKRHRILVCTPMFDSCSSSKSFILSGFVLHFTPSKG